MARTYAIALGFVVAILGLVSTLGWIPVALADGNDTAMSRGVVATVIAIDADADTATLKTEEGEVFTHPEGRQWHVGHQVLCDRINTPRPELQSCRPWESAQVHERMRQAASTLRR